MYHYSKIKKPQKPKNKNQKTKNKHAFAFSNVSDGFIQKELKLSTSAFSKEAIQSSWDKIYITSFQNGKKEAVRDSKEDAALQVLIYILPRAAWRGPAVEILFHSICRDPGWFLLSPTQAESRCPTLSLNAPRALLNKGTEGPSPTQWSVEKITSSYRKIQCCPSNLVQHQAPGPLA